MKVDQKIFGLILIITIALVGISYVYKDKLITPQTQKESQNNIAAKKVSGWTIYKDEKNKYQIEYPNFLEVHTFTSQPNMIRFINSQAQNKNKATTTLTDFRIQSHRTLGRYSRDSKGVSATKLLSMREILQNLKEDNEAEEIKEISVNGLVGFQTVYVSNIPHMQNKSLGTEVYLAHSWNDTEFVSLDAAIGIFGNEEEKKKLLPTLELFNQIVSTFRVSG